MNTRSTSVRRTILGVCALVGLSACATVAPYERERLARADMQLAGEGDASAGEDHARSYREGASGALGASGGGCGCN